MKFKTSFFSYIHILRIQQRKKKRFFSLFHKLLYKEHSCSSIFFNFLKKIHKVVVYTQILKTCYVSYVTFFYLIFYVLYHNIKASGKLESLFF